MFKLNKLISFKQFLNEFEIEGEYTEKIPPTAFSDEDIEKVKRIINSATLKNQRKIEDFLNITAMEYDNNQESYSEEFYIDNWSINTPLCGYGWEYDLLDTDSIHKEEGLNDQGIVENSLYSMSFINNHLFNLIRLRRFNDIDTEIQNIIDKLSPDYMNIDGFIFVYGELDGEKTKQYSNHQVQIYNGNYVVFHSVKEFEKYMEEYNEYLGKIFPVIKNNITKLMEKYKEE